MEHKAKLSYLRIAPRKVRLVADLVRGKDIEVASEQLQVLSKRAALPILKLIRSAVSSAGEGRFYIKTITVDQGPVYKRFRPRARGRAGLIKKITSHINLEIASYPKEDVTRDAKSESGSATSKKAVSVGGGSRLTTAASQKAKVGKETKKIATV